jgi:hypothetical protein
MTAIYKVWRVQFDIADDQDDPTVQRFGQSYVDSNPIGGPMALRLKDRALSSFADFNALRTIDESDIAE